MINITRYTYNLKMQFLFWPIAKTFGFHSPLSNETKQWKIQTSFECQYVQRGYFIGIMVLPIGILLLLIEVTCSCGKFILQLIQGRREGHYTQLRYMYGAY